MDKKIGLFSFLAFTNASEPHGYQLTGLCACWSRYGDFSFASRFVYWYSRDALGGAAKAMRGFVNREQRMSIPAITAASADASSRMRCRRVSMTPPGLSP